ncbi:MAG: 3-ketoacyl-ACP reductase [Spirochaetaceae bacterium]|nr:MAG: 3-ketoacyl-ACP reductase [Spirochaetaceae bacterium]
MSRDVPVVLVTGASRGLGRGIAIELAASGFSVAINYRGNAEAAAATADQCRCRAGERDDSGAREQEFVAFQGDISLAADRARLVDEVTERFGRIDALVNNAGIAPRVRADITEATEESFRELIDTNLIGPYFLTQEVVSRWLRNPGSSPIVGGRKIVFITSISADTASIARGEYCVAKAGLAMSSKLWATRLADDGIQVYEVRPGVMETDMTSGVKEKYDRLIADGLVPQRRWGNPEDVGRIVRSLCAGDFAYSTGAVLYTDGGFHISRL